MNESARQEIRCVDVIAAVNCTLQAAIGRFERCPGSSCPLWEHGKCLVEETRSELVGRPQVAEHLLELRGSLAGLRRVIEVRSPIALVAPGQGDVLEIRASLVPS